MVAENQLDDYTRILQRLKSTTMPVICSDGAVVQVGKELFLHSSAFANLLRDGGGSRPSESPTR